MNITSIDLNTDADTAQRSRQRLLELARHLDRFGRDAEQFLCQQLEQLEQAIDEFEREKEAWRRQLRRESDVIARQREELKQLRQAGGSCQINGDRAFVSAKHKKELVESLARKSGAAPIRLLLQPGTASPVQVGLLMFEISKLNRDMGGRGLQFEVNSVRTPRKRLLTRNGADEWNREILELNGISALPLAARGSHVALDVDVTERIETWIAFKSRLLMSSLVCGDLETIFRKGKVANHDDEARSIIREAARRADDANDKDRGFSDYSSAAFFANSAVHAVQQQIERLESCADRLCTDYGLRLHIEVPLETVKC